MKEEEKDREIEELEKEIQRLELEYRRLLYEPTKYTASLIVFLVVFPIFLIVVQWFLGGFDKFFARLGIDKSIGFILIGLALPLGMFIFNLPAIIYGVILFYRLNKLYRQLAEKKGGVITGFIGDSPVFLRRWSRKRPRRF